MMQLMRKTVLLFIISYKIMSNNNEGQKSICMINFNNLLDMLFISDNIRFLNLILADPQYVCVLVYPHAIINCRCDVTSYEPHIIG